MIPDLLIVAAVELRRLLAEEDRVLEQQRRLGAVARADPPSRAQIDDVITQMEGLAAPDVRALRPVHHAAVTNSARPLSLVKLPGASP